MQKKSNKMALCTIVSSNFLPFVAVLCESINKHCKNRTPFFIIISDGMHFNNDSLRKKIKLLYENVIFISNPFDFVSEDLQVNVKKLYNKYHSDTLRWALRADIIESIISKDFDKVLYLDGDLWFVSQFDFLFNYLDEKCILLSPHWRPIKPEGNTQIDHEFICHFIHGIFNTGFFGFSKEGITILRWWHDCCEWACDCDLNRGIYFDQKYMDLIPVYFSNECSILNHKGCNVSLWNRHTLPRTIKNGTYYIGNHELVFLHINDAMKKYAQYDEKCLWPLVKEYMAQVTKFIDSL